VSFNFATRRCPRQQLRNRDCRLSLHDGKMREFSCEPRSKFCTVASFSGRRGTPRKFEIYLKRDSDTVLNTYNRRRFRIRNFPRWRSAVLQDRPAQRPLYRTGHIVHNKSSPHRPQPSPGRRQQDRENPVLPNRFMQRRDQVFLGNRPFLEKSSISSSLPSAIQLD